MTLNKTIAKTPAPTADTAGLFTATILFELKNTGNTHLAEINVIENLAAHYGCAFLETTGPPSIVFDGVTVSSPVVNAAYLGDIPEITLVPHSGIMAPGDSMAISVEVLLDPTCMGVASPLLTSAYANAEVTDDAGNPIVDFFDRAFPLFEEISDDGTDFDMDLVPDNDTGEKDDDTRLFLPNLAVTKAFTEQEMLDDDDLLLTFEFEIRNTGNAMMDSLTLDDPIAFFPASLGDTPGTPSISFTNVDANTLPTANASWDGYTETDLFDGISGKLLPGQSFIVTLQFEIDPYDYTAIQPQPRNNQATVSGLPKDMNNDPLLNPNTGVIYVDGDVSDLSDDGTELEDGGDPLSDNPDAWGQGEGPNVYDDPTPVNICKTDCEVEAREITHVSLGASCMLEITASMVGVGIKPYCDYYYTVNLFDLHMNPLMSNVVDGTMLGDTIKVQIIEPECNNVSWGLAVIEDKVKPVIECADITISCSMFDDDPIAPDFSDNCDGATIELRGEVYHDMPCNENFVGRYERKWVAVDAYGNESLPCYQTVYLTRFDFDDLVFPPHYSIITMNALECGSGFETDAEGNPDPSVTGVPSLEIDTGGMSPEIIPLYPFVAGDICSGYVEYIDKVSSDPLGCVTRIERTWIVGEWWCSDDDEMIMIQNIDIEDTTPPMILTCPDDITISTSNRSCEGEVVIPPVTFKDGCTDVHVNMQTPQGTLLNTNGATLTLEEGLHTIIFEVVDDCHNMTTCDVDVLVIDEKSPVAICEQDLIVSLNSNGSARIFAEDLNLKSFDDCSDSLTYQARRMDDPCGISGTDWTDEIYFCCEDAGQFIMVSLLVTDKSGNTNACMVEVEVQDKRPARLNCIDNMVIDCSETYAMNNLSASFGFPTITDNCPDNLDIRETAVEDVNQCGIGSIHRKFYLLDASGNEVDSCDQWITITGEMNISEDNIDWPDDFEVEGACLGSDDLHPDNLADSLAYPSIPDGFCNQVGFKWHDEIYDATTGSEACYKIIRTWKVIDWCYDGGSTAQVFPTWDWEQIIKVYNETPPTILSACRDTIIETLDCDSLVVKLGLDAFDDCTPFEDLLITYEIDEDDDGDIDDAGQSDSVEIKYPLGTHRIYWEVQDRCGEVSRCDYTFEIISTKAATPICFDTISVDLTAMDTDMTVGNDTALAMISARMIGWKSEHPCGYDIEFSFSQDVSDSVRRLGCDDVGDYPVTIWVTASNGSQASCNTSVLVTANGDEGFCDGVNAMATIEGNISTFSAQNIGEVEVELLGSEVPSYWTSDDGRYAFPDMPIGGNYTVVPTKDDDHLDGVSTLDIVLITRHVLGINKITTPELMIAADINNSGSISAHDIIELRKLLLGHYDSYPSNTSWRFLDASFDFVEPLFALEENFPENYAIDHLGQDMEVNFIGIKIGDLNGDASANGRSTIARNRDLSRFALESSDRNVIKGDEFLVNLRSQEDVLGLQMVLDLAGVEIKGAIGRGVEINQSNYFRDGNIFRLSINEAISKNSEIVLRVKSLRSGRLSEMITVTNERFNSEAYVESNLEGVASVFLEWDESKVNGYPFTLKQNQPNPWLDYTTVSFTIPTDGNVTLSIRDVTGKLLMQQTQFYRAGDNTLRLRNDEIPAHGVLLYELTHDGNKLNRRMIKVR